MSWWESLLLGILQGLTEYLPVSSSGHLTILQDIMGLQISDAAKLEFDVIVHVAGIVHQPKCQDWDLYKRVNTDMPISIATMAKEQGVKVDAIGKSIEKIQP